jgi:hypothetical protein
MSVFRATESYTRVSMQAKDIRWGTSELFTEYETHGKRITNGIPTTVKCKTAWLRVYENLIVTQLVNKFYALYQTLNCITVVRGD